MFKFWTPRWDIGCDIWVSPQGNPLAPVPGYHCAVGHPVVLRHWLLYLTLCTWTVAYSTLHASALADYRTSIPLWELYLSLDLHGLLGSCLRLLHHCKLPASPCRQLKGYQIPVCCCFTIVVSCWSQLLLHLLGQLSLSFAFWL